MAETARETTVLCACVRAAWSRLDVSDGGRLENLTGVQKNLRSTWTRLMGTVCLHRMWAAQSCRRPRVKLDAWGW